MSTSTQTSPTVGTIRHHVAKPLVDRLVTNVQLDWPDFNELYLAKDAFGQPMFVFYHLEGHWVYDFRRDSAAAYDALAAAHKGGPKLLPFELSQFIHQPGQVTIRQAWYEEFEGAEEAEQGDLFSDSDIDDEDFFDPFFHSFHRSYGYDLEPQKDPGSAKGWVKAWQDRLVLEIRDVPAGTKPTALLWRTDKATNWRGSCLYRQIRQSSSLIITDTKHRMVLAADDAVYSGFAADRMWWFDLSPMNRLERSKAAGDFLDCGVLPEFSGDELQLVKLLRSLLKFSDTEKFWQGAEYRSVTQFVREHGIDQKKLERVAMKIGALETLFYCRQVYND